MKDSCSLFFVKGHIGGIVVGWLRKPTKEEHPGDEDPIIENEIELLRNNADLREVVGIYNIVLCRGNGADGDTPLPKSPTSTIGWPQFLMIPGVDGNTPTGRMELSNGIIEHLNSQNPKKRVRFGGDLTTEPMSKVDTSLCDVDVMCLLIEDLFPFLGIEEIIEDEHLMSHFWTDLAHGVEYFGFFTNPLFKSDVIQSSTSP